MKNKIKNKIERHIYKMSTRSRIGIVLGNGEILSCYCHYDGYIDGVGWMLTEYYDTEDKAFALIELGDMRSVVENFADCERYGSAAIIHSTWSDFMRYAEEYTYLFQDGGWTYSTGEDEGFLPVPPSWASEETWKAVNLILNLDKKQRDLSIEYMVNTANAKR